MIKMRGMPDRVLILLLAFGLGACATPTSHSKRLTKSLISPDIMSKSGSAAREKLASTGSRPDTAATLSVSGASQKATNSYPANAEPAPAIIRPQKLPLVLTRGLNDKEIAKIKAEAKKVFLKHWAVNGTRSTYYRQRILDVFADMDAPLELQVIPIVESGYNPYAISPTGAIGLWQIMPGTARHLGVLRNRSLDGSRHVEESTRAALKYLLQLKNHFHYWPLAIAAYHVGPGHMDRKLRRHPWRPEKGLKRLPAPRITRAYVRHVLGLAALFHNGEWTFPPPIETEKLTVNGPVDLNALERSSGLDRTSLFLLNPGLEQSRYLAGRISFYVPTDKLTLIQEKLTNARPGSAYVTVAKGDTLWAIARRHWIHIADIRQLNPGLGKVLHIGQRLNIIAGRVSVKHNNTALANPLLARRKFIRYKVRHGDSVSRIAHRFRVSPILIVRANRLGRHSVIHTGRKLLIPTSGHYRRKASPLNKRLRYTVRNGDSLWQIARKFGTSVNSIAHANKIDKGHTIRPGDRLWILARN